MVAAITIFLLTAALILTDFLVDDLKINVHNLLHNAVYLLVGAWCLYWSFILASRINYTPPSQISREWTVVLAEIAVALASVFVLRITLWRQQTRRQQAHNAKVAQQMDIADEQESELRKQAAIVANVLGLNQSQVPTGMDGYDGFLQEARKRVQMRSLQRTRKEALALLEQLTIAHTQLLNLRRAQGSLGRIDKENEVKDLELEAQKYEHLVTIEEKKKKIEKLNNPSQPQSQPRSIIIDDKSDDD